jgi:2-polyprenyl-3-methyl-5-hydroxy-6-metoxy-1,4-benzoquinol methylase
VNVVTELSQVSGSDFPDEWYEVAGERLFWFEWRFRAFLGQLEALSIPLDANWHGLDIGCGHGVIRGQIERATAWTSDGADLNQLALAKNDTKSGESYYYDIHDRRPEFADRYDFLFLFDVLEHLEHTTEFIESALYHLRPGGLLFVNVPALNSMLSGYDEVVGHLRRYDRTTLRREADAAGLRVRDLRYWGFAMLPYLLVRKLMPRGNTSTRKAIEQGVVPLPWAERPILELMKLETAYLRNPILGTSLLMIAEKLSGRPDE